jgi:hypothetical protein
MADNNRVHAEIDSRICRSCAPMKQGVLAGYYFERKSETSIGKLISQCLGGFANGLATAQNAMFAEQNDVLSIIPLQVAFDVAAHAAFEMIFKHVTG